MDDYTSTDYNFSDISSNDQPTQQIHEKKGIPTWAITLIVVGVVAVVLFGVIFMGVIFLWAGSFEDTSNGEVEYLNVKGSIDGSDNVLIFEVISGTVEWSDYRIVIDSDTQLTTTTISSSAGDDVEFSSIDWDPVEYMEYNVEIVNIDDQKVLWEDHIIATN